jgi:hypothetical protein
MLAKTFKHSGARGDLLYSLPAVQALGGGDFFVNRKEGQYSVFPIDDCEMQGIVEFLKTQPYIDSVQDWDERKVDYDLDKFRELSFILYLLTEMYLKKFNVSFDLSKKWIDTEKIPVIHKADIVVSRTARYHSVFNWNELAPWIDRAVFIGWDNEYKEFVEETGYKIRHEVMGTWLDIAGTILGSKLFIGNQSMLYAMAEGMKHPRVLEECSYCPNCHPQSKNGHTWLTQKVIRKYLLGEECEEEADNFKMPSQEVMFLREEMAKKKRGKVKHG